MAQKYRAFLGDTFLDVLADSEEEAIKKAATIIINRLQKDPTGQITAWGCIREKDHWREDTE